MPRARFRLWDALTSLKLAITCLLLLMVLVVACTLAQVRLGSFGAVNNYIRSFLVYWNVPGTGWSIPVFPGGGLVGLVLTANLVVAQVRRLEMSIPKLGLWVGHFGVVLVVAGLVVTCALPVGKPAAMQEGGATAFVYNE